MNLITFINCCRVQTYSLIYGCPHKIVYNIFGKTYRYRSEIIIYQLLFHLFLLVERVNWSFRSYKLRLYPLYRSLRISDEFQFFVCMYQVLKGFDNEEVDTKVIVRMSLVSSSSNEFGFNWRDKYETVILIFRCCWLYAVIPEFR